MARVKTSPHGYTQLWLSADDTWTWANRPNAKWPCSSIAGKRLYAEFEPNGDLVDMALDDLRSEYPDVRMVTWAEHDQLHREAWVTPWREVTEDEWHDMLEVLPPSDWHTVNGVESFKMIEHLSGDITSVYARYNGGYWSRNETFTMLPAKIAKQIRELSDG
jgi:hypothetical protein